MAKQDHTKTAHWAMVERWNQRNDERLARMEEKRNEREKREANNETTAALAGKGKDETHKRR